MIRSRRIPPLLSRICGDGIHSALLVTSDGELLGSYSDKELDNTTGNNNAEVSDDNDGTTPVTAAAASESSHLPPNQQNAEYLDMSSIGALISEVAGDYLKLGNELQLIDGALPQPPPPQPPTPPTPQQQEMKGATPSSAASSTSTTTGATNNAGSETDGKSGAGGSGRAALKCLIVELDMGLVGVSSAGLDCYVAALADNTVEYGLLKARLMTLSSYVAEALSQLVEQP